MQYSDLPPSEKKAVETYMRVILYYLRHEGLSDRDSQRRCIQTVRQLLPYMPGDERSTILGYIKSFVNADQPKSEKIRLLQQELKQDNQEG